MYLKITRDISNSIWLKRFKMLHPALMDHTNGSDRLRLIIGPARSGTSWVGQVLGHSSTPLRFFSEPLFRIRPRFSFSTRFDHTAVPYLSSPDEKHPLIISYKTLTAPEYDWERLLPLRKVIRNDENFMYCLVKEVHALLGTEFLLKSLQCPTVFITRDPIYIVDSLLYAQGLESPYWRNEGKYISDHRFLLRFFPVQQDMILQYHAKNSTYSDKRRNVMMNDVLIAALINNMLKTLSNEYNFVYHLEYEVLCNYPSKKIFDVAKFLSLEMGSEMQNFLNSTQGEGNEVNREDPYSIVRETRNQATRPLYFVTDEEEKNAREMLDDIGL